MTRVAPAVETPLGSRPAGLPVEVVMAGIRSGESVPLANVAIGSSVRRRRIPAFVLDSLAAGLMLVFTILFYWRLLTPNPLNRGSFPKGDFVEQFYAFASFRSREIMAGNLPLWNPFVYGGHPYVADIQSGVFYPPSWVTTLLAGPRGYPFLALEVEAIVHIFLAGVGMYLLCSRVASNRIAGIIGGLVYAFGGYLSAYPSQQLSVLEVQTWLPLVLFWTHLGTRLDNSRPESRDSSRSLLAGRRPALFMILGGLTLGLAILAGHPQASLYTVYAVTAYALFRILAATGWHGWRLALRRGYLPAVLLLTGFGVAAVQLVPTTEFMGISSRSQIPYEMSGWAFPLRDILQIILPASVSLYSPMYVGVLPLTLAIAAVIWRRTRETGFWAVLATVALLISFGGNTIIHSVLYNAVPGFGVFRHQERGIVLFSLSMGVLAAIGARALFEADAGRLRRYLGLLFRGFLAAVGVFIVFYASAIGQEKTPAVQGIAAFLVMVLALTCLLVLIRIWGAPRPVFLALTVALVAFDLITTSWQINFEKTAPGEQYRPSEIVKYLQKNDPKGRTHNDWQYPLNYGDVYSIRDVNGASPLVIERYRQLFNSEPREQVWRILGVKYFVTWQGGYPNGEKISVEKTADDKEVNLYALPDPLPRAYVAHSATIIPDDERALRSVLSTNADRGTEAVLASAPAIPPSGSKKRSAAAVRDISTDRLVVETTIDEPGILVLSENYYPGWKAIVDGQPAEILRAQYTLRGVGLAAGSHRIEFVFDPLSLKVGAAASVLTIIVSVGALALLSLGGRRAEASA